MACEEVCIGTSDYEQADFYAHTTKTARKPHICCECNGRIEPGEQYDHVVGKWDGDVLTYKTCASCAEIREKFTCGKGFLFECLWEDLAEYAFPVLTLKCLDGLSSPNKARVIEEWRKWKGLRP